MNPIVTLIMGENFVVATSAIAIEYVKKESFTEQKYLHFTHFFFTIFEPTNEFNDS